MRAQTGGLETPPRRPVPRGRPRMTAASRRTACHRALLQGTGRQPPGWTPSWAARPPPCQQVGHRCLRKATRSRCLHHQASPPRPVTGHRRDPAVTALVLSPVLCDIKLQCQMHDVRSSRGLCSQPPPPRPVTGHRRGLAARASAGFKLNGRVHQQQAPWDDEHHVQVTLEACGGEVPVYTPRVLSATADKT